MSLKCAVPMCKSSWKKDCKFSFHKFPIDVPVILEQWLKAINRKNWTPVSSSRICHLHFKNSDFSNTAKKILRLKPDIIPSLNLPNISSDEDTYASIYPYMCNIYMDTSNINTTAFIHTSHTSIEDKTRQANNITSNVIRVRKAEKRTEILQSPNIKHRKLEKENKELKLMIKSLTQKYEQQLNNQADMFQTLMEEQRNALKQKLIAKQNKCYSLNKKNTRMHTKLKSVIQQLKK